MARNRSSGQPTASVADEEIGEVLPPGVVVSPPSPAGEFLTGMPIDEFIQDRSKPADPPPADLAPAKDEPQTVLLEVTVAARLPIGYIPRKVETPLDPDERQILKRLTVRLCETGARLANGRLVGDSMPMAIRWLLQEIAEASR